MIYFDTSDFSADRENIYSSGWDLDDDHWIIIFRNVYRSSIP
jgi:hypothetical protein